MDFLDALKPFPLCCLSNFSNSFFTETGCFSNLVPFVANEEFLHLKPVAILIVFYFYVWVDTSYMKMALNIYELSTWLMNVHKYCNRWVVKTFFTKIDYFIFLHYILLCVITNAYVSFLLSNDSSEISELIANMILLLELDSSWVYDYLWVG